MFEVQQFQKSNPDESIRIMAEAENMSVESMAIGLEGVFTTDLNENIKVMNSSIDHTLKNVIDEIGKYYFERGQIPYIPEFNEVVEPRFVNELS